MKQQPILNFTILTKLFTTIFGKTFIGKLGYYTKVYMIIVTRPALDRKLPGRGYIHIFGFCPTNFF